MIAISNRFTNSPRMLAIGRSAGTTSGYPSQTFFSKVLTNYVRNV
jgi:hypothetical protein